MNEPELKAQLAATQAALVEAVNALEHLLALYMHTVYGSYDGKTEQPTPVKLELEIEVLKARWDECRRTIAELISTRKP